MKHLRKILLAAAALVFSAASTGCDTVGSLTSAPGSFSLSSLPSDDSVSTEKTATPPSTATTTTATSTEKTTVPSSTATTTTSSTTQPESTSTSTKTPSHFDNPTGQFFDLKQTYENGLIRDHDLMEICYLQNGHGFFDRVESENGSYEIDDFKYIPEGAKVSPEGSLSPEVERAIREDFFYYFMQGTQYDAAIDQYGSTIEKVRVRAFCGRYGDYYAVLFQDGWGPSWPATNGRFNIGGYWFMTAYYGGESARLWKPNVTMEPLEIGQEHVLHGEPRFDPTLKQMLLGDDYHLHIKYDRVPGDPKDLFDFDYVWSCSDTDLVTLTPIGAACRLTSCGGAGTVTITVDVFGWHLDTEVEVVDPASLPHPGGTK